MRRRLPRRTCVDIAPVAPGQLARKVEPQAGPGDVGTLTGGVGGLDRRVVEHRPAGQHPFVQRPLLADDVEAGGFDDSDYITAWSIWSRSGRRTTI